LTPAILKEFNCSPYVIQHSKAVMIKALQLASNFKPIVDLDILETGAWLHDVGRSRTDDVKHAIVGADMLKTSGFPSEVVKIVERHIGAGITREEAEILGLPPRDYLPFTIEEKLVAHADNLIHGTQEVNLDFVTKKWGYKLGEQHPSLFRLRKLHFEVTGEKKG
jgi:uncharacterized protein